MRWVIAASLAALAVTMWAHYRHTQRSQPTLVEEWKRMVATQVIIQGELRQPQIRRFVEKPKRVLWWPHEEHERRKRG